MGAGCQQALPVQASSRLCVQYVPKELPGHGAVAKVGVNSKPLHDVEWLNCQERSRTGCFARALVRGRSVISPLTSYGTSLAKSSLSFYNGNCVEIADLSG